MSTLDRNGRLISMKHLYLLLILQCCLSSSHAVDPNEWNLSQVEAEFRLLWLEFPGLKCEIGGNLKLLYLNDLNDLKVILSLKFNCYKMESFVCNF